ncbi:PREDICTED: G-protein coupled estrogen receptor 1 isoform X2 [Hipposideros armiger]|uniref:G-protein coupled estrogen receptor 1 isoform X2 n=1 Tax=Hipposideros armiger TaxID=186990 RepID=A0A8B7QZ25_HIPAR|nr:PREDICTED: G-protein coupled estrogen receptor 1 isoform X2 [Hipposideros armiger]
MSSRNMSWVRYPSRVSTALEDVIASQDIISRCVQVYMALLVPVSLVTGLFNLTTFIRGRARLGHLDAFLSDLTVTNVLVTLLSLTAASRPDYLDTTHLGCAILSFLSNVCYFNAQYVQLAMLFVFLLQGPSFCLCMATKGAPGLVLGLVALGGCALCSSLGVVALLGTSGELHRPTLCQLDPLTAWPEYEIVKVCLGCGLALILELAFLTLLAVQRARPAAPPQRDAGSAHPAVVAVALTTFACRLPYNITLLQRARLKLLGDIGSPRDELRLSLAELVLFGESCVNSLVTLFLHKPCRLALLALPGRLSRRCRRGGRPAAASPSSE